MRGTPRFTSTLSHLLWINPLDRGLLDRLVPQTGGRSRLMCPNITPIKSCRLSSLNRPAFLGGYFVQTLRSHILTAECMYPPFRLESDFLLN